MDTTNKKSIHKGFALIWLVLTTAGLFAVTQEALGVTCPWSLGSGQSSAPEGKPDIHSPSNRPDYSLLGDDFDCVYAHDISANRLNAMCEGAESIVCLHGGCRGCTKGPLWGTINVSRLMHASIINADIYSSDKYHCIYLSSSLCVRLCCELLLCSALTTLFPCHHPWKSFSSVHCKSSWIASAFLKCSMLVSVGWVDCFYSCKWTAAGGFHRKGVQTTLFSGAVCFFLHYAKTKLFLFFFGGGTHWP